MKLELAPLTVPLREPFVAAGMRIVERQLLLLRLESPGGCVGWGEVAPLTVAPDLVRGAIEDCRDVLACGHIDERAALREECARLVEHPAALAAIDMALWDLDARRAGEPLWRLLGASAPTPVECNATIAAPDRAGAARAAAAAREDGFGCLKVKVGLGDDAARVAAVRAAAGSEITIRLDANGVWTTDEAVAALRALAPVGVELCEEPASGVIAIRELAQRTAVAISIDETAAAPGALDQRLCDAVCLKVVSCGGISGLLHAAKRARNCGYELYLASMLDGPLGISAALHAAAALKPERPCGLATLELFARECPALAPRRGAIAPPPGPGLGDGLIGWYRNAPLSSGWR